MQNKEPFYEVSYKNLLTIKCGKDCGGNYYARAELAITRGENGDLPTIATTIPRGQRFFGEAIGNDWGLVFYDNSFPLNRYRVVPFDSCPEAVEYRKSSN